MLLRQNDVMNGNFPITLTSLDRRAFEPQTLCEVPATSRASQPAARAVGQAARAAVQPSQSQATASPRSPLHRLRSAPLHQRSAQVKSQSQHIGMRAGLDLDLNILLRSP